MLRTHTRRIGPGDYETEDGRWRVVHDWDETAGDYAWTVYFRESEGAEPEEMDAFASKTEALDMISAIEAANTLEALAERGRLPSPAISAASKLFRDSDVDVSPPADLEPVSEVVRELPAAAGGDEDGHGFTEEISVVRYRRLHGSRMEETRDVSRIARGLIQALDENSKG